MFHEFAQHSIQPTEHLIETTQSLLRFDMDIVGLGEVRNLSALNVLTALSLSSIHTLCTLHAHNVESLLMKLKMLAAHDYERFYYSFHGVILLKNIYESPVIYRKDHALFHNIFCSTAF
jgi:type II secretory ATPase GspE/PulE/Tfp pilus assembly ATPase PilB-like protein